MNINFSLINEFVSFLIFFYFSCFFLFPILIKILNNYNLIENKKNSFIKFNKTLENKFYFFITLMEKTIKDNINSILKFLNNTFFLKNKSLINLLKIEKINILNSIKKIFKIKKKKIIKNFFKELKIIILKSFKNIYNEIILYNNEFIINYE